MTTGRVAAALTALCLLCQPAFGFIKVFPEFDDEPGAATFFWAAVTTVGPFIGSTVSAQESSADEGDKLVQARDDAASFVASDGAIHGAYLQAALQVLRQAPENAGTATCNWPRRSRAAALIDHISEITRTFPAVIQRKLPESFRRSIRPPPAEDRSRRRVHETPAYPYKTTMVIAMPRSAHAYSRTPSARRLPPAAC